MLLSRTLIVVLLLTNILARTTLPAHLHNSHMAIELGAHSPGRGNYFKELLTGITAAAVLALGAAGTWLSLQNGK